MGCMFSKVAAKFAFFPPTPSTYQIINKSHDDNTTNNNNNVKKKKNLSVVSTTSIPSSVGDDNLCDVLLIDTKKGNKIVGFFLKNPYARLTLLYSHGNAADLGQLYDLFVQLKVNLRVNIMGYDYSGYGASTGKPSERNTYADIEAVYECLQTEYGISQEDLILYGQSVGSGPTLHLAAKLPRLRGIVLHSGILSGLRVLCHVNFSFCYDIYKNINKIKKVKCPVLVIHGTEDDVVNLLHGNKLWKMAREPYEPLWIKGGGHCNLELYPDYIRHLCRFIKEMEDTNTKTLLKKIWPNIRLKRRCRIACCNTSRKCCTVKLRRPRCSGCCSCTPSCVKCFSCRKFPNCCKFSCCNCGWWPKCSKCWRPSCCCGGSSKCWRPSCCCGGSSKCWRPSCCCGGSSKCWRSSCCCGGSVVKCLQPQCSCCYCGGGRRYDGLV